MNNNQALVSKAVALGYECYKKSELSQASLLFKKALQIDPRCFDAYLLLGIIQLRLEKFTIALPILDKAVTLNPRSADANHHLALALKGLGDSQKASHFFSQAIKYKPSLAQAHLGLADVLADLGNYDDAIQSYIKSIELNPASIKAHNNLGHIYRKKGLLSEAIGSYRNAIDIDSNRLDIYSNLLMCMASTQSVKPEEYIEAAREYSRRASNLASPYSQWPDLEIDPDKRLRVGWVSGDLREHPVAEFLKSFLEFLEPNEIEHFAFVTTSACDDVSFHLQKHFQEWLVIEKLSDKEASSLIYNNKIDILIDLSGHTARNRLPLFAWKAAPVQISWIGYFASTGMASIDYLLPNRELSPSEFESHYSEKPWYLTSAACLAEPDELPDVNELPAKTNGYITFSSLHSLSKISDDVLKAWCKILTELPNSKILFKCKELVDPALGKQLLEKCQNYGISADRIILEESSPLKEYFKSYHSIDIGLDPFPYNSGTVGYHSLLMGVPYIAFIGDRMLSRIGYSNLTQVDLERLAASNVDEYVRCAIDLAKDIEALSQIRNELRTRTLDSGLFNGRKMASELQSAFRQMWQTFLDKPDNNLRK